MTKADIIKLAREAGFNVEQGFLLRVTGVDEDLERFAALVRAAIEQAQEPVAWDVVSNQTTAGGFTVTIKTAAIGASTATHTHLQEKSKWKK